MLALIANVHATVAKMVPYDHAVTNVLLALSRSTIDLMSCNHIHSFTQGVKEYTLHLVQQGCIQ